MTFFLSFFFGIIGTGYFFYGRKQQKALPMVAGIAMGVFPLFISNGLAVLVVGILLMVVPYFSRD